MSGHAGLMHTHGKTATGSQRNGNPVITSYKVLLVSRIIVGLFELVLKTIKFAGETEYDDKKGCHPSLRGEAGPV